jgi:hypothetical protein
MGRSEVLKLVAKALRQTIADSREGPTREGYDDRDAAFYRVGYLEADIELLARECEQGEVDLLERRARPAVKVSGGTVTP